MPKYELLSGNHDLRDGRIIRPNDPNTVVELTEEQYEKLSFKFRPVDNTESVEAVNEGEVDGDDGGSPVDFEAFVSDGNATDVRDRIRRGEADGALDAVLEAEKRHESGRSTVTNAVEERREELSPSTDAEGDNPAGESEEDDDSSGENGGDGE